MPTIKQLSRIQSEDTGLNRLQDQLAAALNPILREVKGDLTGPLEAPEVAGLRGRIVSPATPEAGATLVFDGREWVPAPFAYGLFYSHVDQIIPAFAANTPLAAAAEITDGSRHVTVESDGTNLTRFTVKYAGIYEVTFSAQLNISGGTTTNIYNWLRVNGVDVPDTTSDIQLGSNHKNNFPYNSFIVSLAAGGYVQFMFAADSVTSTPILDATAAVVGPPAKPLDPSIIVSVKRLSAY